MLLQPYQSEELTFAWCYRVYYRWRTHRRKPISVLPELTAETLGGLIQPYGIHLLELAADPIDVRALVSLAPNESVSVAASKMKGRVSKWLAEQFTHEQAAQIAGARLLRDDQRAPGRRRDQRLLGASRRTSRLRGSCSTACFRPHLCGNFGNGIDPASRSRRHATSFSHRPGNLAATWRLWLRLPRRRFPTVGSKFRQTCECESKKSHSCRITFTWR